MKADGYPWVDVYSKLHSRGVCEDWDHKALRTWCTKSKETSKAIADMREKAASWEELADQMSNYLVDNEELKRQPRKIKSPVNTTELTKLSINTTVDNEELNRQPRKRKRPVNTTVLTKCSINTTGDNEEL